MLPQSDTERLLEEHLGRLGIDTQRQTELSSFAHDESGITAVLRNADGQEEVVKADWLIGCDGAHSAVRHRLGLSFLGNTPAKRLDLADLHLSGYPMPTTEMVVYWHEDGVLLIIPMSATRFRIIADLGLSQGNVPANPTLDQVQAIMGAAAPVV